MNAPIDLTRIGAGFADYVVDAQQTFRAMLAAMARPGTTQNLHTRVDPPVGLTASMTAMGLTLLDGDVTVWLSPSLAQDSTRNFLHFHTACRIASEPDLADFALVGKSRELPSLATFALGTDAYPDRSTTVLVQIDSLEAQPEWRWRGPGIRSVLKRGLPGLPAAFLDEWHANRTRFPRGVDMLFAAASEIVALPRTIRLSFE